MKKAFLMISALLLCAGMAMAQEPVKKDQKSKQQTEQQAAQGTTQAAPKHGCGGCGHKGQCGKKENGAAVQQSTQSTTATPCGNGKGKCSKSTNPAKADKREQSTATK